MTNSKSVKEKGKSNLKEKTKSKSVKGKKEEIKFEKGYKRYKSEFICPNCQNRLYFWISNDYYLKGHKFYECMVCEWKPSILKEQEIKEDNITFQEAKTDWVDIIQNCDCGRKHMWRVHGIKDDCWIEKTL